MESLTGQPVVSPENALPPKRRKVLKAPKPVNKVLRASVSKPTAIHQWNLAPNQRSAWLKLEAGKRYYIEILHKAGTGPNDHWSVGWLQDPTGITIKKPVRATRPRSLSTTSSCWEGSRSRIW